MKWCQPHWNQLREAIRVRGLDGFGAQNAQQAHDEMVNQIEGSDETFDPLLGSFWRINSAMLDDIGLRLMGKCPLCILVEDGQPHLVANWIDGVTDSAKQYAIEKGLIKSQ